MGVKGKFRFAYGCCTFLWLVYLWAFYIPLHYSPKIVTLISEKEESQVLESIKMVIRRFPVLTREEGKAKNDLSKPQNFVILENNFLKLLFKNYTNSNLRNKRCRDSYTVTPELLPDMSIIVVFQRRDLLINLLKMLVTLLVETPPNLIKEIILVNDNSLETNNLNLLDDLPKITIVNLTETLGAVGSRLVAASVATGDVIFFADTYCVFTENWSQPLLETIKKNPNAIVSPIIQKTTNEVLISFKGGFTWTLNFKWIPFNDYDIKNYKKDPTSPIRSPIIPSNIYMMSRMNYLRIGEYDESIDLMNLQNIGLSLAVWQCGGEVVMVPCSRILYLSKMENKKGLSINKERRRTTRAEAVKASKFHRIRNAKRIAEIWMDEYSHYFYEAEPSSVSLPSENIEERVKIRQSLKCQSFSWYLLNVFTELAAPMPIIVAHGQLSNNQKCITGPQQDNFPKNYKAPAELRICETKNINQNWDFSEDGWLFQKKLCLSASKSEDDTRVFIANCVAGPQQRWQRDGKKFIHAYSGLCVDSQSAEGALLHQCKEGSHTQRWDFTTELDRKFYKSNKRVIEQNDYNYDM